MCDAGVDMRLERMANRASDALETNEREQSNQGRERAISVRCLDRKVSLANASNCSVLLRSVLGTPDDSTSIRNEGVKMGSTGHRIFV